ncbi:MAG: glutathione synthetase [Bacteroidetes bacterium]|nr:glutathione synthetase [Bacteroidota bacterium]
MSKKWKILVLTDHSTHNPNNSVYELCNALNRDNRVAQVVLASKGHPENKSFFEEHVSTLLKGVEVTKSIDFDWGQEKLSDPDIPSWDAHAFNFIWLRLPRPIPEGFFDYLETALGDKIILNRPSGINESSPKSFLLRVQEICPPIKHCENLEDIKAFQQHFPIVLKPLEDYGGRGILRVESGKVLLKEAKIPLDEFASNLEDQFNRGGYLAMKFLKNVHLGDKRVVVVNGEVIGGILRVPPKGSWLCNASQGGQAQVVEVDPEEYQMAKLLHSKLAPLGVAIFGMDTLVNDDGKRVLSEVNTLSIGGIDPLGRMSGIPASDKVVQNMLDFAETLNNN